MAAERQQPTMDLLHLWAEGPQVSAVPQWQAGSKSPGSVIVKKERTTVRIGRDYRMKKEDTNIVMGKGGLPGSAVCIRHRRPHLSGT